MFKGVSHPGPEQRCLSERAAFRSSLVAVDEAVQSQMRQSRIDPSICKSLPASFGSHGHTQGWNSSHNSLVGRVAGLGPSRRASSLTRVINSSAASPYSCSCVLGEPEKEVVYDGEIGMDEVE